MILSAVTSQDCARLFVWRNDPITREQSTNTAPISWSNHKAWFSKRFTQSLFFIAKDSIPVGTVRVDSGFLSYIVAPEHRNKGYATEMLDMIFATFGRYTAKIKSNNTASIRAARKHCIVLLEA